MAVMTSGPFAIYETREGIELLTNHTQPENAKLICNVSDYQSAIRIARAAAKIRQLPLLTDYD
jgi:hypothetical protein